MPSPVRSLSNYQRALAVYLPLVLTLSACVNRPLPPRISLDELVQQAILKSSAHQGGDENLIHRDHQSAPVPVLLPDSVIIEQSEPPATWVPTPVEPTSAASPSSVPTSSPALPDLPLPVQTRLASSETPRPLPPVKDAKSTLQTPVRMVAFQQEDRLTEEFIETDIREALTTLALQANVDLVLDDKITGIVNTRIDNLTI